MFQVIQKIQSSPLMDKPRQVSFSIHSCVAREPALWLFYQPYFWWGQLKKRAKGIPVDECIVSKHTELVIDGFQGSANSFATVAFKEFQQSPVKLAHHLHSPAQIIRAVDLQIPVLLTIREPIGTVISLTSRWSHISVSQGLRSYTAFYNKLKPYAEGCMISNFAQTTQQLDQVIHRLNQQFQTSFDLIDMEIANRDLRQKVSDDRKRAEIRPLVKEKKRQEILSPENTSLLKQAMSVYQELEPYSDLN
jgi:hypothetical protein